MRHLPALVAAVAIAGCGGATKTETVTTPPTTTAAAPAETPTTAVAIDRPAPDATIPGGTGKIVVAGSVAPPTARVVITVNQHSKIARGSDGQWKTKIAMPAGANTITAKVLGQPGSDTSIDVTREEPPPKPLHFEGNGDLTLPPFKVRTDSTLKWTANGGLFAIYNEKNLENSVPVSSQADSGKTFWEAGNYRGVQVNSLGDWTIDIVPNE